MGQVGRGGQFQGLLQMTIHTTDGLPGGAYAPPTGISKFHASYDDTANTMTVTVRGRMVWAAQMGTVPWDVGRQTQFLDRFRAGIADVWNQKFTFERRGGEQVTPVVRFETVDANQHMTVRVQAGVQLPEFAAMSPTPSSMKLYGAGLDIAGGNLELRLDEGTVLPYSELITPVTTENLRDHAAQSEAYAPGLAAANDALQSGKAHIKFGNGSAAIDNDIRQSIRDTIAYVAQNITMGHKRIPLEVTGYRNSSEARNLSMDRANAVAAAVRTLGHFEANHVMAVDGGDKYWGHRYVKIRPLALPRILAQVKYKAAIHEFGHCLGLPDEYRLYEGMTVAGAHGTFSDMCRDNRLTHPRYPEKHDSIMSCGMTLHRCHYVTILDCLKTLSGDDSWMILNG